MSLFRNNRRICVCLTALTVLSVSALWLYVIATRGPINRANFSELKTDMSRGEVETLLGGAASTTRTLPLPIHVHSRIFESWNPECPIPGAQCIFSEADVIQSHTYGAWVLSFTEIRRPFSDPQPIAEVQTWDGPDVRIVVSFDDEGNLAGARFLQRNTWSYKLRQWLPWLP